MCVEIFIINTLNFTMNTILTTPYNADFDGDEMNYHVIQSIKGRSEVINIRVANCLLSPHNGLPILGLTQDSLVCVYKLTLNNTFIPFEITCDIVFLTNSFERWNKFNLKKFQLISGKVIVSLLFPDDFDYEYYGDKIKEGII